MASLAALFRPNAPGFWLVADLLLGLALWFAPGFVPPRWRSLSRVLRWVALPYVALLVGAMAPQAMGLTGVDWQVGLTIGLGFVVGVTALLAVARLAARTPLDDANAASDEAPDAGALVTLYAVLHHGAEQFHWCFQRAALLALLTALPRAVDTPAYWAAWGAVLLALPGLWTTPPGLPRLYKGIALVATAILFFYTRNFWLCWALHAVIMLFVGAAWLRPELAAEQP